MQLTGQSNTSKKEQRILSNPQRLSFDIAHVLGRTSIGQHKTVESLKFEIVCKLNDLFAERLVGFDEELSNEFFRQAGYTDRIK